MKLATLGLLLTALQIHAAPVALATGNWTFNGPDRSLPTNGVVLSLRLFPDFSSHTELFNIVLTPALTGTTVHFTPANPSFTTATAILDNPFANIVFANSTGTGSGATLPAFFGLTPNAPLFPNAIITSIDLTILSNTFTATRNDGTGRNSYHLQLDVQGSGLLPTSAVPEPSTLSLLTLSLLSCGARLCCGARLRTPNA
jgi:hypothetical protein